MSRLPAIFSILCPLFLASCVGDGIAREQIRLISPAERAITVDVEIADEPQEHTQGLMFRETLSEGTGMMFIFPEESMLAFWMKNTLIPLDILFFADDGTFVSSATMEPCLGEGACPTHPSAGPARYALEVQKGFAERLGIGPGWRVDFPLP